VADLPLKIDILPAPFAACDVLSVLHAESFEVPWGAAAIENLLQTGAMALLAMEDDEPVGMILVRAVLDEAEILTIATRPTIRGQGVGAQLLAAALAQLSAVDVVAVHLEVAVDNGPALALYRRSGFEKVGRRRGYYDRGGGSVDALVLRRTLNTSTH
jgi:ribosomal-protein-alanine N-acetyltransferase